MVVLDWFFESVLGQMNPSNFWYNYFYCSNRGISGYKGKILLFQNEKTSFGKGEFES